MLHTAEVLVRLFLEEWVVFLLFLEEVWSEQFAAWQPHSQPRADRTVQGAVSQAGAHIQSLCGTAQS